MGWYMKVLNNYADFSGRARRTEYWMFQLFNILILIALAIVAVVLDSKVGYVPVLLYALVVLIPAIAVAVRRLHDTDRSGWWILIDFVPIVGPIILLVFLVLPGDPAENQYGPDPKAAT